MKTVVISLGGSLIVPDSINFKFLESFRKVLRNNYKNYRFVVVCGGGSIARKYISLLGKENVSEKSLSLAGIRATRMNAMFLMQFFGDEANNTLPRDMKEVKSNLHKNKVVICGALRFVAHSTSDATAARIAHYLGTEFINLTNIKGLYSSNPITHKDAKFIPYENWKEFEKRAHKIKHKPGQHFVLDQKASTIIRKHKIRTYIVGPDLRNLQNILENKKFIGTLVAQ